MRVLGMRYVERIRRINLSSCMHGSQDLKPKPAFYGIMDGFGG